MNNYTYHGASDLIVLPGRSVQTYPSGLVRVERSFACRRGQESSFRSQFAQGKLMPLDDGKPAIDGLYIFPDPQETARDDGFVEFRVTAYGRTNTTGRFNKIITSSQLIVSVDKVDANNELSPRTSRRSLGNIILTSGIHQFCVPSTSLQAAAIPDGVLGATFQDTGQRIENFGIIPVEIFPELLGYSTGGLASDKIRYINTIYQTVSGNKSNFGFWDEYTITYITQLTGTYLGIFRDVQSIGFISGVEVSFAGPSSVSISYEIPANSDFAIVNIPGVFADLRIPHSSTTIVNSGRSISVTRSGDFMNVGLVGFEPDTIYTGTLRFANQFTQSYSISFTFRTARFLDTSG